MDEDEMDEEIEMEEVGRGRDGGKRRRRAERERDEEMDVSEEDGGETGSVRSDEMDHEDGEVSSKVSRFASCSFSSCRSSSLLFPPLLSHPQPSRRTRVTSISSDISYSTQSSHSETNSNSSNDSMTSPSPPPPSKASKSKNKRLLSEIDAESTVSGRTSSSSRRQTKRRKSQSNLDTADITSSDDEEEDGKGKTVKTWNDPNGIRFRMKKGGERERLVLVKKLMRKFVDMPADSTHPDRNVM